MAIYNANMQEVEQIIKDIGTGYPSVDRPWRYYFSKEALTDPLPEMTLYQYLKENNRKNLDSYALNYYGKKITYRELFKRIDEAAKAFRAHGVKPGDIVSVVTLACVPCVVCYYALNKIGAVIDYVNVLSTAKDMVKFFRTNKSRVIVSADVFVSKVLLAARALNVEHVITFSMNDDLPFMKRLGLQFKGGEEVDESYLQDPVVKRWDEFIASADTAPETNYKKSPETPALLAHTGGTTGFPKSVLLSDNAMNAIAAQYHYLFKGGPNSVFLDLVVPFVVYGSLINMHMPLTMQCTLALIPQFDPEDWPEYFNKYKPNYMTVIPNYITPMLKDPRMRNVNLERLQVMAVGGEGLGSQMEAVINRFLKEHNARIKLSKGYGMTELGASACTCFGKVNMPGSVGVPLPRNEVMIFDNDKLEECRYNEVGEVCFQSPAMMLGYLNDDDEYRNLVRRHADGSVWVHTGDLGYMNRRGMLFIVGRIKRAVLTQYKGVAYRVYPNIIEDQLMQHPAVREVCVVKLQDDARGRMKAYVALRDHNRVDEAELERELRSYCESELAEFMRPSLYEFRGSLPKTPAGKVDYKLLENLTVGSVSAHSMPRDV